MFKRIPFSLITLGLVGLSMPLSADGMIHFIRQYEADRSALTRKYNVEFSTQHIQRLHQLYTDKLLELNGVDFENFHSADRIDWILMKYRLESEVRELDSITKKFRDIQGLVPFSDAIIELEQDRRMRILQDGKESATKLNRVIESIDHARKEIEKRIKSDNAPGAVEGRRAAMATDSLRRAIENWREFYQGFHPEMTWWIQKPAEEVEKALKDYSWFLKEKLAGYTKDGDEPVIGDPIGLEALIHALEAEMIAYTPEELIRMAEQEFAWCEREMKRAADDLGYAGDWSRAMEHVSKLHVDPGLQPKLIVELAEESIRFLEERDLVTIPDLAKEVWRMEMMPEERQKVNPYFTGGEVISITYPTSNMSHEDKLMSMRGNNRHFSRATVHHEIIPGHHLQLYMAQRYNTHRNLFRTPFLVEGWALYWEMLLWDLNFQQSPEDRVGMLFWRSHRCARILFSLKFHLGEWTAQEAIDFLIKRVGHEPRNATAEVRRSVAGDYSPLYQAAYMLGGLQIRALHKELVDSGKMSVKDFHDAVLRENAIPIDMIRASLSGMELEKDYAATWRFYP